MSLSTSRMGWLLQPNRWYRGVLYQYQRSERSKNEKPSEMGRDGKCYLSIHEFEQGDVPRTVEITGKIDQMIKSNFVQLWEISRERKKKNPSVHTIMQKAVMVNLVFLPCPRVGADCHVSIVQSEISAMIALGICVQVFYMPPQVPTLQSHQRTGTEPISLTRHYSCQKTSPASMFW